MSSDEMLDVFNEQMVKTGTASRRQVHAEGLWHQTFQCWVVNMQEPGNPGLVFQLRAEDKDTFPGKLDISCAGHLLAGETPADGIRELEEELGITSEAGELIYCGMVAQESLISEQLTDREFNHVFLLESRVPLKEYPFQRSEISGLFLIGLQEYKALLNGEQEEIQTREGVLLNRVKGTCGSMNKRVTLADFTPNSEAYYRLLFGTIDKINAEQK
ncbi:NUDIX hydrolase [Paenibacillus caui]|uniref:NUDIX hydrolase n=1 Tax=Paenibacillus caui TaxID=2873927 RepID=UPI001CA8BF37|nr:NUDIX domain-containing protein [Paenibacillus caui]